MGPLFEIKRAVKLLILNYSSLVSINQYPNLLATIILLLLAGFSLGFSQQGLIPTIFWSILASIGLILWVIILYIIALFAGGKQDFIIVMRSIIYPRIILLITLIPEIRPLLILLTSIWLILVDVFIIKSVYSFETRKAILIVLIPMLPVIFVLIIAFIISLIPIFGPIMGGNLLASFLK